jgi:tRNA threonylcarbamoyladenosine modification (KEOPS) complex  Pcc1 subunit
MGGMMALAATYGFTADQGATFSQVITWKDSTDSPIDLTGYTARMQIRQKVSSSVALALTTENGRITLGNSSGTISLYVTATDMAALPAGPYTYDIELVSGSGAVSRLLMGTFVVRSEVTR